MDMLKRGVCYLGCLQWGLLGLGFGQTTSQELVEALDYPNSTVSVSGNVWKSLTVGAHDGEDVVMGETTGISFNRLTMIPEGGGTMRFWSKMSGSMRVFGSRIEQRRWDDETRPWEHQEVFVSPTSRIVSWRLYGASSQAWIDEVEVIPAIPANDALDSDAELELEGNWAGFVSAQSSDGEDHLRLFGSGRLETTLIGPGKLRFQAQGQVGRTRVSVSLDEQWLTELHGRVGDWETVSLQVPPGRHKLLVRNSGDMLGIDAFEWEPGWVDPLLDTLNPNSERGLVGGTLQPVVEISPNPFSRDDSLKFGPKPLSISEGDVVEGKVITTVKGPGRLSFWWRTQQGVPESNALSFRLDGREQAKLAQFSGEWVRHSMDLAPGEHLVNFHYQDLLSDVENFAWLADLRVIASPKVELGEALDAPELNWWTGGTQGWAGYASLDARDGQDVASSGAVKRLQKSWIVTNVTGPGVLRCWWRCSGGGSMSLEDNGRERMAMGADGQWRRLEAEISAGDHVLRWVYSGGTGSDPTLLHAGSVDEVSFTPGTLPLQEALGSNLAFAHNRRWSVMPDGRGGMALQASDPGARLQFVSDGTGVLQGELHAEENALAFYQNASLLSTLEPEPGWRTLSIPLSGYGSGVYRFNRDLIENGGKTRLGKLRFVRDPQLIALENAAEMSDSLKIMSANEASWEVTSAMARMGNTSIAGHGSSSVDRMQLRVDGPGVFSFDAKALMESPSSYSPPYITWSGSRQGTPFPFDSSLESWQTLHVPNATPWDLFVYGGSGLVLDAVTFIPALLREQVDNQELTFRTGGDDPWRSVTSAESPDGVGHFFAGEGWLETEVDGPATLALRLSGSVSFEVGEAFEGDLVSGYSEIPVPIGSHRVRFTSSGVISDVKLLSGISLAEALDLTGHRFVSISRESAFVPAESSFDGQDALSIPADTYIRVGFMDTGIAGYRIRTGSGWVSADQLVSSPLRQVSIRATSSVFVDQLSLRQPRPLSEWPVPLTTSVSVPWVVVPFPGVPDGDDVSIRSPSRAVGWLEATVEGPGELWFASRGLREYGSTLVDDEPIGGVASTTDWAQERFAFGSGEHRVRWESTTQTSSIDGMRWEPRNRVAEALDVDFPFAAVDQAVRFSGNGGMDGDDALHLAGKIRLRAPSEGVLSLWWRKESDQDQVAAPGLNSASTELHRANQWHRIFHPISQIGSFDISGEGHMIDRLEFLDSPSYQEALETDLAVEESFSSYTVSLAERDFAHGPLKLLAPAQGRVVYQTQIDGEWLAASQSGTQSFAVDIGKAPIDAVQFSTGADPFGEAVEWPVLAGGLETLGWAVQSEVSREGSDALMAMSQHARLSVTVEGPGTLSFLMKREGNVSLYGYWDGRRDVGDGWTRIVVPVGRNGKSTHPISLSQDSSDFESPWAFWVDELTYTPNGAIDPAEAVDSLIPLTLTHSDLWAGQASIDAEDGDALRLVGSSTLEESSASVALEGPGTFSFSVRSEDSAKIDVRRGGVVVLPQIDLRGRKRITLPIPSGSHEVVIRFAKDDGSFAKDLDLFLDHLEFVSEAIPPLRQLVKGPVEVALISSAYSPPFFNEGGVSLQAGKLYFHFDQPGRLSMYHVGRFGIGNPNVFYLSSVEHPDWGFYEYESTVATGDAAVIDPSYRFSSSIRVDPADYPRIREILFAPAVPEGTLAEALDVENAVSVVSGVWTPKAYGDPDNPAHHLYGMASSSSGIAAIETELQGPGLLRFRFRLGQHYQTSMKLFIDDVERWEATVNGELLEAVTAIDAGTHRVRWQVTNPNSVPGEMWLDAVEVVEAPADFLTPFGLASTAPAVSWSKVPEGGEAAVMRGDQLGARDGGSRCAWTDQPRFPSTTLEISRNPSPGRWPLGLISSSLP